MMTGHTELSHRFPNMVRINFNLFLHGASRLRRRFAHDSYCAEASVHSSSTRYEFSPPPPRGCRLFSFQLTCTLHNFHAFLSPRSGGIRLNQTTVHTHPNS